MRLSLKMKVSILYAASLEPRKQVQNGASEIVSRWIIFLQRTGPVHKHKIVQWQPPPPGSVKLNFDGSV